MAFEIVTLALVDGEAPLGDVLLPWRPGVVALYGLNGAGKTRVVDAATRLLAGDPSASGHLVCRWVDNEPFGEQNRLTDALDQVVGAATRLMKDHPTPDEPRRIVAQIVEPSDSAVTIAVIEALVASLIPVTAFYESLVDQIREVADQGWFLVRPSPRSSISTPRWVVHLGVKRDEACPALTADFAQLDRDRRSLEAHAAHEPLSWLDPEVITASCRDAGRPLEAVLQPEPTNLLLWLSDLSGVRGRAINPFLGDPHHLLARTLDRAAFLPVPIVIGASVHREFGRTTYEGSIAEIDGPLVDVLGDVLGRVDVHDGLAADVLGTRDHWGSGWILADEQAWVHDDDLLTTDHAGHPRPSPHLLGVAEVLGTRASAILGELLVDSPALRLRVGTPNDWVSGRALRWVASEGESATDVEIDDLSEAQRRWGAQAVLLARRSLRIDAWQDEEPNGYDVDRGMWAIGSLFLSFDEPDAALHPTAERHLVNGLVGLAQSTNAMVLVSTHSPAFLNHPDVTLLKVDRPPGGRATVRELTSRSRDELLDLGLQPADLFQLHRVVLVVEGSHDVVVLRTLIGDDLDRLGVLLLPLRGGRQMATVIDAGLVTDYSDAAVVLALDNLDAQHAAEFWEAMKELPPGDRSEHDRVVNEWFPTGNRRAEEVFLIEFARNAAGRAEAWRFKVFGFSKPDIPLYLPAEVVVPGHTWDELWPAFEASKQKSFKPWLEKTLGLEITEDALAEGAKAMDAIPEDFTMLLDWCRQLSTRTNWRRR